LLGIASAAFLGPESRGINEQCLFVFYREGEREKEKKNLGVVGRGTTLGVGVEKTISSV
jgi:hypothetical protein